MVTLVCSIVGEEGSAFPVDIDASQLVGHLKKAIKEEKPNKIQCDADELQLFLAKKGDAWLKDDDPAALELEEGNTHQDIQTVIDGEKMRATKTLQHWLFDKNKMPQPSTDQIHVLVVVPESSAKEATAALTPVIIDQVEMAMNKVLKERDEKMLSISISTCTRSKEGNVMTTLGYKYSTIDVAEDIDGSIHPYAWHENVAEDHLEQRTGYMQYFRDNLPGVLNQDDSRTTPSRSSPRLKPKYYLKDSAQVKNLLDCDVSSSLPFKVKGTTDMMIIDEAANSMDEVFAGLHFVIELKKEQCGVKERCQILLELVAADLKSENRCAPVGLLTNLNNYWYFLWFTPGREIARLTLRCPANGFQMMKELLKETNRVASTGVFPMRIPFLRVPLPKRQKLLKAAPAGDDAATEMLERYELMSDELSPEFLLARRMEYEFRMVREMPIHSGMYS